MKALVLYDSFFGNTEKIAQAVGEALGTEKDVTVIKVEQANYSMLESIDIFVVGSPTRGFNPTPAVKSFLKNIQEGSLNGVKVAAFDTRIPMDDNVPGFLRLMVKIFGYADKPLHDLLLKKGGQFTISSEGFFVADSKGPLLEGELARAAEWAQKIKSA